MPAVRGGASPAAAPKRGGSAPGFSWPTTPSNRMPPGGAPSPSGRLSAGGASPTGAPAPKASMQAAAPVDDSLWGSAALVAAGLVTPASEEDLATLSAQVTANLEGAEFVGGYAISAGTQRCIFEAVRASMAETRSAENPPAEKELWHGTRWDTIPKILKQGFNRSFAGRHGTLLGVGTYFSTDLSYSNRFCDRRGAGHDCTKVAILARVIVGNFCKGCSTDIEPPIMDEQTRELFDSTVDNEEQPTIFAVFRDFQALPLFLVEFRT